MKKIFLFFAATVFLFLSAYIYIWWLSLGKYETAEHWLKNVYDIKSYRAGEIKEPKIILLSGSNGLFGISSKVLSDETGMPVINMAGHAALSFNFLADTVIHHVNSGDIVLMPLEFEYYSFDGRFSEWQMSNMQSWGADHVKHFSKMETLNYFMHAKLRDTLLRVSAADELPAVPNQDVINDNNKKEDINFVGWNGYDFRSLNFYGEFLVDLQPIDSLLQGHRYYIPPYGTDKFFEQAIELASWVQSRQATLYFTWPVTIQSSLFDMKNPLYKEAALKLKSNVLHNNLSFICEPENFNFPPEYFFNTNYHLNYKGAILRSINLANCLADEKILAYSKNTEDSVVRSLRIYSELKSAEGKSNRRIVDLTKIKLALKQYYAEHGSYPSSKRWDGLYSNWGDSKKDWIDGLVPKYAGYLPRDPRRNQSGAEQYLYMSNGVDYKLISHSPEDCSTVQAAAPELIDPTRNCWAYGFWTDGASSW